MKNFIWLLTLVIFFGNPGDELSGQKPITVDDIWTNYRFNPNLVPGFNFLLDGTHYARLENGNIEVYDIRTGASTSTMFAASMVNPDEVPGRVDGYTLSDDESRILLTFGSESVYRRSTLAYYAVWDRSENTLQSIFPGNKLSLAVLSPDAQRVAFVFQNNVYTQDLRDGEIRQITEDGVSNAIINGTTDWVYEEEFSLVQGIYWSPQGNYLAYYRFDESEVPEYTIPFYYDEPYPRWVTYKYPKVGERNSEVSIHIYELMTGRIAEVAIPADNEYVPRIKWTRQDNQLCVLTMNRHQNELKLELADAQTGSLKVLLEETNPYYIDIQDDLTFLPDGEHFIWSSEKDGYNHIYLYDMQGREVRKLTQGSSDVTKFYGYDAQRDQIYYQAASPSPMERQVFTVKLDGSGLHTLNNTSGTHEAQFSQTFDYWVDTYSRINQPPVYTVFDESGRPVRTIEDNRQLASLQREYGVSPVEFFSFTTSENVSLNGWMIKPPDMDPTKKYPVFMFLYGGPGSQQVLDNWRGQNYWWFQSLAQQGYLVACVDNRGTGARGQEFRKMTYKQLGHYETLDQIEAARYLGSLPYTDATRVGIFGWSYGGYMSSLCVLKGNDVFKMGIAVAPVTNWKWYDNIYTERYMQTEEENPEGYHDNSPVYFADRLKGAYLLVHGLADDNVHFQNTAEMANALIAANKQFETYFYPNRNHGIYGNNARTHLYTKMTNFILNNL
ncbi:MAG: S9 family peptidase [Saprospiraceae bacterium]